MSRQYRTIDGDTADLVAFKFFGAQPGSTEAVLESNPGLADLGPIIPLGTVVVVPDLPTAAVEETVQLWD